MRTIYIDILLCVQLAVNFLLLSASSFYTSERASVRRRLLGAAVGSLGSLIILLPPLPDALDVLAKAAVGFAAATAAFCGGRSKRAMIRLYTVFLVATFFFGGAAAAVWFFFAPSVLFVRNGAAYFDISPTALILISAASYALFRLFLTVSGRRRPEDDSCVLTLKRGNRSVCVSAAIDTGNTLREPFSGCPVIVMGRETARVITPAELAEFETVTTLKYRTEVAGVRFVPFTSVGGRGILPCFPVDEVFINDRLCSKDVYVALCRESDMTGGIGALVPSEII